jgi:PIN domain nuclease of toxin-antitoxin system
MGRRAARASAASGARVAERPAQRADVQLGQPVGDRHAVAIDGLPPIHKDPFDRLLIAQSMVEGITLLTSDPLVAQYPAPVRKV